MNYKGLGLNPLFFLVKFSCGIRLSRICIKITTYSEEPSWINLTGNTSRDMVCLTIYDDVAIAGQCGKL